MSRPIKNSPTHDIRYVTKICLVTALGGLLFGYDTAVISGAVGPLQEYFSLSPAMTGWAVSNVVIGCIIGSFFAGKISFAIGRKKAMALSAVLFFISALGSALAPNFTFFVLLRMVGGLAVGLASVVSPMYLSEVSPKNYRGRATSLHHQSVVVGQTIVFFINYLIAKGATEAWLADWGWRYMLGSEMIPAVILCSLLYLIPESPRWCALKGRDDEAFRTLSKISNPEHARQVLADIKNSMKDAANSTNVSLRKSGLMPIVIIGTMIACIQQITGINVLMYYTPEILKPITGGTETALLQTTLLGVVFIASNFLGMYLIDRVGRIPLMKVGSIGSFLGMLLASWGIFNSSTGYTALMGLVLYLVSYSVSWGCCTWALISEIYPNRIRSQGMAMAVAAQWVTGFIVAQTFPMLNGSTWLQEKFNGAFSFWLFSLGYLFAFWFICRFVPETKGVSLEKMEAHFMSRYKKPSSQNVSTPTAQSNP